MSNAITLSASQLHGILVNLKIEPTEDFTAAAGQDYGYVAAWDLGDHGYLIQHGDNGTTEYDIADDADDLAAWLEYDDVHGLDAIIQTANVRGSGEVDEVNEADDAVGPFYVLITRDWYGPTETSSIAMDEYGQNNLEFSVWQDAQDWIDAAEEGIYSLSHNESGAPSYKIVTE